jgi:hypothetical protein
MSTDMTPGARTEARSKQPLRGGENRAGDDSMRDEAPNAVAEADQEVGDSARPVIPLGTDNPEKKSGEQLAPLFAQDAASDFRARWVVVQQGFVDDPRRAVQEGDELVREVISNLAETFSQQGGELKSQLGDSDERSTEMLRVALRRYRAFFERLLSV